MLSLLLMSASMAMPASVCDAAHPTLMSIALGMTLREVQRSMGPGKLTARAPDPGADWQFYYMWRRGASRIETVLDRNRRVAMVSVSGATPIRVPGKVTLNRDTVQTVEQKLGPPTEKIGPAFGEGEYAFLSLVYRCGTGEEILFMTQRECTRPDMNACLSQELFARMPILKVAIRRPAK